jgi:hypothetical protein
MKKETPPEGGVPEAGDQAKTSKSEFSLASTYLTIGTRRIRWDGVLEHAAEIARSYDTGVTLRQRSRR